MKKKILIIAPFTGDMEENSNNRFNYLSKILLEDGFDVELVTSSFSHQKKMQRSGIDEYAEGYKITHLFEPGYKKNVALGRIYSHYIFSRELKKYLGKIRIPDVVYCAVPTLSSAKVAADFSKKNDIKFVIDVQDLWPEAFEMFLPTKFIYKPFYKLADYVYSEADHIVSVSQTYLDRASQNNKSTQNLVIYLGTDMKKFDKYSETHHDYEIRDDQLNLVYLGTLGHSYDLRTTFDSINQLYQEGILNIKLWIIGDGPLKGKFQRYAEKLPINVEFTGRLPYQDAISLLKDCDVAINPIASGSAASIINKHADYSMASLPVINTQENDEYRFLVEKYGFGINCKNNDEKDLATAIKKLAYDEKMRKTMGKNSREFAEVFFDRNNSYKSISKLLEGKIDDD